MSTASTGNFEMMEALQALALDKGISVDSLLEALANALVSAYKRMPGAAEEAYVTIDADNLDFRVYGQELDEDGNVAREWDATPENFGRIAAQTAKQVLMQKVREAERELKYEEYAGREGDIVTGIIQQTDSRFTLLDLGKVEALLPQAEQVPYERPEPGTRLKAYIVEVRKNPRGPQIVVSRTHPGLIKRLFELEVPEIADGIVILKAVAREPGHRTKIAVWSNDSNVDPVGACVGARGARVRMVVNELRGEKIDIVPYTEDLQDFVMKALSPAKVKEVRLDHESGTAEVIVPDYQLSLAIGKEGQNARLAARLTGWRVDIKSETQLAEEEAGYEGEEWAEGEWREDADSGEMVWHAAEGGPALSADQWNAGGGKSDGTEDGLPDPAERGPAEGEEEAAPDDGADRVGHDTDPGAAPTGEPPANDKPPVEGGDDAAPDDGADRPGGES
ncbi:MAG: Transcription termination protein NusA [uncultured Acidimicrobiales bacterium]|uniref:Transcription termination/antitermination protein NusA n=1 Tax=uncultured Acidimicrobiales bacterium TaxID=310071 RepID=A0A6J4II44_9ACTN|nr:MAG: Transcription termination protein NusA [uncultured Acidimicrobiales bacterium]